MFTLIDQSDNSHDSKCSHSGCSCADINPTSCYFEDQACICADHNDKVKNVPLRREVAATKTQELGDTLDVKYNGEEVIKALQYCLELRVNSVVNKRHYN